MVKIGSLFLVAIASAVLGLTTDAQSQQADMSFFVSSVSPGKGADLGGLAGADAHCQALAKAAGSTSTNWAAYLSTTEGQGNEGVNARSRIGNGPWKNSKGVVIATSVENLHSAQNNLTKQTSITEKGEGLPGSFVGPGLPGSFVGESLLRPLVLSAAQLPGSCTVPTKRVAGNHRPAAR